MLRNRLVVVEVVYFQTEGGQPVCYDSRFDRAVDSDEDPFVRHVTVTDTWQPLDLGWVKDASCLVIGNEEGKLLQVVPSPAEAASITRRIVEVGFGDAPSWEIAPGESMRGTPVSLRQLKIRCRAGTARVTILAFPR